MKKFLYFLVVVIISVNWLFSKVYISGKVIDSITKDPLEGVIVTIDDKTQKFTDQNGAFSIESSTKDTLSIVATLNGYSKFVKKYKNFNQGSQNLIIPLDLSSTYSLMEIKIKEKYKIEGTKNKIKSEQIKKNTTFLFSDSMKTLQTLPGVVTGDDFSSLMYVRGGEFYEVVCFLDNIYIASPYMWAGLQSIFNPNFVDTIDFYSGGFPAKYPQGLSGVLDVKNKVGNMEKHDGFFEASLTSLEVFSEGPIKKDKISYMFGVRRTYYDLVMNMIYGDKYNGVVFPFFYDTQSKITYKIDEKNTVFFDFLSSYEGMNLKLELFDNEELGKKRTNEFIKYSDYRLLPSLNWEHIFNENLYFNSTLSLRNQNASYEINTSNNKSNVVNNINDTFFINKLTYIKGLHTLESGLYFFNTSIDSNGSIFKRNLMPDGMYGYTNEFLEYKNLNINMFGTYIQDDIQIIKNKLLLNIGSIFESFSYNHETNVSPRGGIKYFLDKNTSLKFNTGLYTQLPLVSSDTRDIGSPLLKQKNLQSEKAIHYILGLEKDLPKDYFLRLETYQKKYYDRIVKDPNPDTNYTNKGERNVYGFDFFLQKKLNTGRFDGWVSYSYLYAKDRIIERSNAVDFINQGISSLSYLEPVGEWYPFNKEREHTLAVVLNYKINEKYKLATTYKFATGLPYTSILSATKINDNYIPIYGEYLSERLPNYQRLDVKLTMPFFGKQNWESFVQITNLLNNKNVNGYYYSDDYTKKKEERMLPLLIIFGVKYSW